MYAEQYSHASIPVGQEEWLGAERGSAPTAKSMPYTSQSPLTEGLALPLRPESTRAGPGRPPFGRCGLRFTLNLSRRVRYWEYSVPSSVTLAMQNSGVETSLGRAP